MSHKVARIERLVEILREAAKGIGVSYTEELRAVLKDYRTHDLEIEDVLEEIADMIEEA